MTQGAANAIGSLFGGGESNPTSFDALSFDEPPDRGREALDILQDIRQNHRLVTVKTTLAIFDQMSILKATLKRSPAEGNGTRVVLTLKRLTFAESDVTIAIPLPEENRGQKKKTSIGAQGLEPIGPPERGRSALKEIADILGAY